MGACLQFGILGPLEVRRDGATVQVGGPRQRALLAVLLCNANEVLSRDRLIDELLADQPFGSPERTLRVQVSRLRKVLATGDGEPRLIARPPGYVLRVEPGELDLQIFEGLVRDGRAALENQDPDQAAALLGDAQRLWRGRPLADLESEPFARVEVQRLEELRLLALEDRVEAELALGRHAALCGELAILAAEYPLRERLCLQLMLALYRSDRQADALAVYRQTDRLLREELGLEPSRSLRELERAILDQDASLDAVGRVPVATLINGPDICPFKGLASFDLDDAEYFFGRERIVADLVARAADSRLIGILGPSGIGKSSLLRAGVLAALTAGASPGAPVWRQVLLRPGDNPCDQLERALDGTQLGRVLPDQRLVIAVDQLEELFTACERPDERVAFLAQLWAAAHDAGRRVLVLVALRGDFYMHTACHAGFADLLTRNHVLLGPMDRDQLGQAIRQPAARVGLEIEPPLVDALVSDAAAQSGGLPLLSSMLVELWHTRDGRTLRYARYRASGGMHAAVARMAEAAYARLSEPQRSVARGVLLRLASERDDGLVRRRAPIAELERIEGARPVLEALTAARLLTIGDGKVELSHEALLREWPRYRRWLEEDRAGRRLHAHLTAAAVEWDAQGRDPGELYRGARLADALEWRAQNGERLNSLEHEFLTRSQHDSDRERGRQRAQNRRLRSLLVAVGVLLLVAVGAAVIARRGQQSATDQARASLARQLAAEAGTQPRLDLAMLTAREAVRLGDSAQTESALLGTLLRSPAVIGTIALPSSSTATLAFAPDGRTLAVGDALGELRLYDARTHASVAPPVGDLLADQSPVYSPDGTLIAYRTWYCTCWFITVRDARTLQLVANLALPASTPPAVHQIPSGGIAIAPDHRELYYAYWLPARGRRSAAAYVQRWALPSGRALPVARVGAGPLLAVRLLDAGARLSVLGTRTISEFATRSMRLLHTARVMPAPPATAAATISPDGRTAVIGSRAGAVEFVSVATGTTRIAGQGLRGAVASLLYARNGRTVVSVGADDSVVVWDPRTARPDEVLSGPPAEVAGAAVSPDGRTLYTSSGDGALVEWDLAGDRRFGHRAPLAPTAPCCGQPSPPAPPLAVSPDGSTFAIRVAPSTVGLFSSRTLGRLRSFTIRPKASEITALAWSPAGDAIAVAGRSGLVQLWRTNGTPRLERSFVGLHPMFGQLEAIQALAFSPDGSRLVASDDDLTGPLNLGAASNDSVSLAIWQVATGTLLAAPGGLNGGLGHGAEPAGDDLLAFSPDGKLLAMSLFDRTILILSAQTGAVVQAFGSTAGTTSLAFSPDGVLANGTPAGTVELWNPITGKQISSPLVVAPSAVVSIAFDPTGKRFATTGRGEGAVKLWITATGQQQGPSLNTDPGAASTTLAFGAGGSALLAVDDNGTAFSWPMSLRDWELRACGLAGRNFTHQEWSRLVVGQAYTTVCP